MTFDDAIKEFLRSHIGVNTPGTIDHYIKRLKPLATFADKPLRDIAADDLRTTWIALVERKHRWGGGSDHPRDESRGLSPFTLDGYFRAWSAFFNWCVLQEYIGGNPMRKLRRPSLPNIEPKAIPTDDLNRLLAEIRLNKRDYAIVTFFCNTNCRVGGLTGIRLDDVELSEHRVWVTEKGRGGGKRRAVYLHGVALAALKDYLFNERRWGECDSLFLAEKGRGITNDGVRMVLRRLAARLKLRRANPHSFRHWFARNWLNNGGDLVSLSKAMGHNDPQVTIRFYARWDDKEIRGKHEQFARLPGEQGDAESRS